MNVAHQQERGSGILLQNNQRQHRTLHIQQDVLPSECAAIRTVLVSVPHQQERALNRPHCDCRNLSPRDFRVQAGISLLESRSCEFRPILTDVPVPCL